MHRRICMLRSIAWTSLVIIATTAAAQVPATPPKLTAQQEQRQALMWYSSHADKHEYQVPMRDGKKLYTVVYTPRDGFTDKGPYPFLMTRTPYSCGDYG